MRVKNKTLLLILALLFLIGIVLTQDTSEEDPDSPTGSDDPNENNPDEGENNDGGNNDGEDDNDDKGENDESSVDDLQEIQVGEYYKLNKKLVFNNSYQPAGYFFFTVKDKAEHQHRDLVIMVQGRMDFTHNPALFYSLTNKHPDLSQADDVSCGLTGHDFCIIPDDKVKSGQTFYLGVHCIKSCQFDIYIQYDPVFTQPLNSQVMYESQKDFPYTLDLQINLPKDLDPKIEHILIESYLLNFNQVTTSFNMYIEKGLTRPSASSYKAEELKLNGQSFLIEKSIHNFQPGDVFSVAIDVPPKAKMLVRSEGFQKERTLYFFKSVDDMVRRGQIRYFKLEISPLLLFEWDKEELSIDLEPYFGNPDLYVNHGSLPENPEDLSSYTWSSTEQDGQESLTITKGEINNKSVLGEVFYIAVYGESAASFRLLAYSSSIEVRQIDFNCVENGYTIQNEIINYQLPLEVESDTDITIKLTTIQGDAQLFVKRCMDITKLVDCQITLADINNNALKGPDFLRSIEYSKNHKIDFKYQRSDCITVSGLNKCTFVVGVFGSSKGQNKYRLLAKHTIQPIQLRENEDHRSFLLESEKEYYKFTISQEDLEISKVEFSINVISGQITAFSSRNNTYPDQTDYEQAELGNEDIISYYKSNKNKSLKGSYYIGIQAISGCIYTIHVKIYRHKKDSNSVISNMKQVQLGNVERGYLSYLNPHQYYFTVDPKEVSPTHQTNIVLYFNAYKNETGTIPSLRVDPNIQISYIVNKTTVYNVTRFQEDYISSDFIYIKIYSNYTENGKYVITLSHQDEVQKLVKIKYFLNVNAHNIIYIVPRGAYIQDLSQADLDNYELYVNEPAKVYLEVFECFGKVAVQAASSIEKIENKIYDIKSNIPSRYIGDHTIINYERDSKGPLYFTVQSLGENESAKIKSLYMIIPHILNKKSVIPHEVFSTPSEGQISTDITFDYDSNIGQYVSNVQIKFGPIVCANGCIDSVYKPETYSYIIHVTNKDNYMQYFAKCSMDISVLQTLGINDTDVFYNKRYKTYKGENQPNQIAESFSFLPNGTYYVEVMGVLYLETNYTKNIKEPFTFIYPMKQFVLGDSNNNQTPNIIEKTEEKYILPLFIMVPIGIALLALILICIYKQIKTYIIRRRYRLAMMMQDKNPDVEQADKEGNINEDDEKENRKKVDKINFLN